jgi:hypothetical protein
MSETKSRSDAADHKGPHTERATIRPMEWQPAERLRYALAADCDAPSYDPTRCDSEANLKREALNHVAATILGRTVEQCRVPPESIGTVHPTNARPLIDALAELVDVERPPGNYLDGDLVAALCQHRGLDVAAIEDGDLPATLPGDRLDTEGDR